MKKRIAISLLAAALGFGAGEATAQRPAPGAFDIGPRATLKRVYSVTLHSPRALRPGEVQTVRVLIEDANGKPVEGAVISVDGGMPVQGHGLPTRPRATQSLGGGVYAIEDVRFGMEGWWQLRLAIASPAGADNVIFNLTV